MGCYLNVVGLGRFVQLILCLYYTLRRFRICFNFKGVAECVPTFSFCFRPTPRSLVCLFYDLCLSKNFICFLLIFSLKAESRFIKSRISESGHKMWYFTPQYGDDLQLWQEEQTHNLCRQYVISNTFSIDILVPDPASIIRGLGYQPRGNLRKCIYLFGWQWFSYLPRLFHHIILMILERLGG